MKRRALVGFGIVVAVLLTLVAAVSIASADPPTGRANPKPRPPIVPKGRIVWNTPFISQTVTAGTTYTATVTFTSTQTITNAAISIAPNMPLRVKAIPATIPLVEANVPQTVDVVVTVPPHVRQGRFNSTVYVRAGRVVLPQALRVHVTVPKATVAPRLPKR